MSWVETTELYEGRDCDENEKGHLTYTAVFNVEYDSLSDGPALARLAPGIPARKSAYIDDARAICTGISVKPNGPLHYIVTCSYTTDYSTEYENPLDEPPVIEWSFSQFEEPCDKDVETDAAITNTAGDPFDPGVTRDDSRPILKFSRNEASFSLVTAYQWRDKINESEWNGFPAKTAKIMSISARKAKAMVAERPFFYWEVNYEFAFREETWQKKVLNTGFQRKYVKVLPGPTTETRKEWIKDAAGQNISNPVLLKENGNKADIGDDPYYCTFNVYQTADFAGLGISL